jgi:hypothetical protein
MNERERNVVDFLPQRTYRLAGLLTEACQLGGVADAYGAPVFRRQCSLTVYRRPLIQ